MRHFIKRGKFILKEIKMLKMFEETDFLKNSTHQNKNAHTDTPTLRKLRPKHYGLLYYIL